MPNATNAMYPIRNKTPTMIKLGTTPITVTPAMPKSLIDQPTIFTLKEKGKVILFSWI
jgi:hypothetical protein